MRPRSPTVEPAATTIEEFLDAVAQPCTGTHSNQAEWDRSDARLPIDAFTYQIGVPAVSCVLGDHV